MIGSGLKKYAKENGMKTAYGMAYGSLKGYAASMNEGAGYKKITLSFCGDSEIHKRIAELIGDRDLVNEFRLQRMELTQNTAVLEFYDNPGTMALIRSFIDFFVPILSDAGALGVTNCSVCGETIEKGKWIQKDGIVYYAHTACEEKLKRESEHEKVRNEGIHEGSYLKGIVGAILGALVGSLVYTLLYCLGTISAIGALAIIFLANYGYKLLKGKQTRVKLLVLIVSTVFGILVGQFAGDVIDLIIYSSNELDVAFTVSESLDYVVYFLFNDAEYLAATVENFAKGIFVAIFGGYVLYKKESAALVIAGVKELPDIN